MMPGILFAVTCREVFGLRYCGRGGAYCRIFQLGHRASVCLTNTEVSNGLLLGCSRFCRSCTRRVFGFYRVELIPHKGSSFRLLHFSTAVGSDEALR